MGIPVADVDPRTICSGPRAAQLRGVESPATVLLHPAMLSSDVCWWAHPNSEQLVGGLQILAGLNESRIGYAPTPIPRSWQSDFYVVLEYESEHEEARFQFRLYYGCGDPSELRMGQTPLMSGESGGKQRAWFKLSPEFIARNQLFRATIGVRRKASYPVLIYGCWLEVGVD